MAIGIIISIFELNFIYAPLSFCISCEEFKNKATETLFLKNLQAKSIIYMILSLPMIYVTSINYLPGVLLFLSGVINLVAGIVSGFNSSEGVPISETTDAGDETSPLTTKNLFGTF